MEPDIHTLRAMHRAHLLSVPFENLDIHLGLPIVLDEARLFDKIVTRRRGLLLRAERVVLGPAARPGL